MERALRLFKQPRLNWFGKFDWGNVWQAFERQRQRRALLRLDDHMLKDIGISRCDAEREAAKPFWRI